MNIYTQRFVIVAGIMLILVFGFSFFASPPAILFLPIFFVGYFSVIAAPAKLFADQEKRMPSVGELARYPILWAVLFACAITAIMLGVSLGSGAAYNIGAIFMSFLTVAAFAGLAGVIAFPLFVRLYLRKS